MRSLPLFNAAVVAGMFLAVPAFAADLPLPPVAELPPLPTNCAVSDFNGKIFGAGGYYEDDNFSGDLTGWGQANVSLPLGCQFAVQVDGGFGSLAGQAAGGVGAHLFTRDPSSYLLGVFGSYSAVDNDSFTNDIWRIGAEAEVYLDQMSIEAVAGYEDADLGSDDWFASVTGGYYITDDFRITAGYRHFLDVNAGIVGAEWLTSQFGLPASIYGQGQFGDGNFVQVVGGVRLYFGGEDKSLKRRHREDDPDNRIMEMLRVVESCSGLTVGQYEVAPQEFIDALFDCDGNFVRELNVPN